MQNDGSETPSLLITGTICLYYRGVTYNTPIDMYLPPNYPNQPPIIYVRPASNMVIKEGHNHVGNDGMVYMPYLHSWTKMSHNLVDACLNMTSIFSNEPPCYAKPPGYRAPAPAPAPRPAAAASPAPAPAPPSYQNIASTASSFLSSLRPTRTPTPPNQTSSSTASNNAEQERLAKIAREAEEANQAVAVARAAEAREAKQKQEEENTRDAKNLLASKCVELLHAYKDTSREQISSLVEEEIMLQKSRKFLNGRIDYLKERQTELEACHAEVDEKIVKVQTFIEKVEEEKKAEKEVSADELALPADVHSAQMLVLSAENAAINDALFFLDKGLADHRIGLDQHMRSVRKLAKRQFLIRAHLLKIGQVKAARKY